MKTAASVAALAAGAFAWAMWDSETPTPVPPAPQPQTPVTRRQSPATPRVIEPATVEVDDFQPAPVEVKEPERNWKDDIETREERTEREIQQGIQKLVERSLPEALVVTRAQGIAITPTVEAEVRARLAKELRPTVVLMKRLVRAAVALAEERAKSKRDHEVLMDLYERAVMESSARLQDFATIMGRTNRERYFDEQTDRFFRDQIDLYAR